MTATPYQRIVLAVIAMCYITAGSAGRVVAKQPLFEAYKRVIVIDAGHGGDESGARGPDGTVEKTVTLDLARILAAELQREYRVVLTRTDDLSLDLEQRTALANYHRANIFVSLHTGGSFVHSTSGISVYHYQNFSEDPYVQSGNAAAQVLDQRKPTLWDHAQDRHLEKSRILANLINSRLSDLPEAGASRIQGAPLLVLQAADMPAILIEIGYLTNPAEEKKLRDQGYLTDLARKISLGIDEYFERPQ